MKKIAILALGTLLTLTACGSGENTVNPFTPGTSENPSVAPANPSVNPFIPSVNPQDPSVAPVVNPSVNPQDPSVTPIDPSVNPGGNTSAVSPADPSVQPEEKESDKIIEAMGQVRNGAQKSLSELNAFSLILAGEGSISVETYETMTVTDHNGVVKETKTIKDADENIVLDDYRVGLYVENAYDAETLGELRAALGLRMHSNVDFQMYTTDYETGETSVGKAITAREDGEAFAFLDNGNVYLSLDDDIISTMETIIGISMASTQGAPQGFSLDGIIPANGKVYLPLNVIGMMTGGIDLQNFNIAQYTSMAKFYEIPHFEEEDDVVNGVLLAEGMLGAYGYKISDFLDYSFTSDEENSLIAKIAYGPTQYRALLNSPLSALLDGYAPNYIKEVLSNADFEITFKVDSLGFVSSLQANIRSFKLSGVPQTHYVYDSYDEETQDYSATTDHGLYMNIDLENVYLNLELSYGTISNAFPESYEEYELLDVSKLGGMQGGQKEPTPEPAPLELPVD